MNKRSFAIAHRTFTFLDEWLGYGMATLLLWLYLKHGWPLWPFIIAIVWLPITIAVSYKRQWDMEKDLD